MTRSKRAGSNRGRRGAAMVEAGMWIPVLVLLMMGMFWIGNITYTYHTLRKTLWAAGSYVSTQQGVDFCNAGDPAVSGAINLAITGTGVDPGDNPILPNLTSDMISMSIERLDPTSGVPSICDCSLTGCDTNLGGGEPDFVVVTIPGGYPILPVIPGVALSGPILLNPIVRVPFGGT